MKLVRIILLIFSCLTLQAQEFPYRYITSVNTAPTDEVNCMFFDKDGLMWLGTNAGLKSYDGYQVKTYKSSAFFPGILPNNNIRSISEDRDGCLWIGTRNGLVRMNRRTGEFKTFQLPQENQRIIYTLFHSSDGRLWVGTDGGLSYFNKDKGSFYTYNVKNSWVVDENGCKRRLCGYSVKSIVEDRNGDVLVGTWSSGLLRLKRKSNIFYRYPRLNEMNSAYSLFFDRYHRLWVGTWGYGVLRIDHPENLRNPQYHAYPYITKNFDTYYQFVEDSVSQAVWACTREGVCFLDERNPSAQWQCYNRIGTHSLNFNNSITTDGVGNIWLCTQNFGVQMINTAPVPFKLWNIEGNKAGNVVNYISSLQTIDGEWFWLGLNPYGLVLYNRKTGNTLYNRSIPGFSSLDSKTFTTSISCICRRKNGELWFANNNYGIIVKAKGKPAYLLQQENTPFIVDNFVNTIFEARNKVLWIGQRNGLSVVYTNNKGVSITMCEGKSDFTYCDIRNISQDRAGNIWLATDNEGIIRVSGSPLSPKKLKFKQYNPKHKNYAIDDAVACYEDRVGRLWAISNSGGLFLYDKEKDSFEPKNREYHIPGERALALNEDCNGNLWLTTEKALVHVIWGGKSLKSPKSVVSYTQEDGIGDLLFAPNATCSYGKELFFGNRSSILSFVPANVRTTHRGRIKLVITDLLIDGVPFSRLDSTLRKSISKDMPAYTKHLEIPSSVKKFELEFSLLTYGNTQKNMYAYRLGDNDNDWQYCSEGTRRASFQNLSSGVYTLYVKATDRYGVWQDLPYPITIKVLPPWYASRFASMVYILLFIGVVFVLARWYKGHLKTKNRLQMGVVLTNITHELLTPLTVISATIYKLKNIAPQYAEDYDVMDSNINRTNRLLRQILEVRKSQDGQLKLLVKRGNLIAFVEDAVNNIRPMAEHQCVSLTWERPKGDGGAWFDTDKMDKILYNLLSNAIKYNKLDGNISVSLVMDKDMATITISDNGIGMSKEKLKHLYTRFFDGDYRRQNMPGTGIGLALTHDLVKLHRGSIQCESTEGQGTTFSISIPIRKSAYGAQEIENSSTEALVNQTTICEIRQTGVKDAVKQNLIHHGVYVRKNVIKILVVEDNKELLALMLQVLSKHYHVFTAKNGKQAMRIIANEPLDLVVSDVMMPVMDGIELTKQIKINKSFWQLPVILLTAKDKEDDKTEAYAVGADAYITKPFKFEELLVRIDSLLANRKRMITKIEEEVVLSQKKEVSSKPKEHLSNPDQAFVLRATEMVMKHLSDSEYDRETFAKDMALGSSTLYYKVKSSTGQTVVAFITSIRLKEACRIMQDNPDILISNVAASVGFNTPKYFSKCFKKEFGVFPKEYADELKKKQYGEEK